MVCARVSEQSVQPEKKPILTFEKTVKCLSEIRSANRQNNRPRRISIFLVLKICLIE